MTASSQSPNQVRFWLRKGLLAARAGDRAEARDCFQKARDADPDNTVALLWLAWLAPTREESLVLFTRVLELNPKNERAHAGIRWARRRPSARKSYAVARPAEGAPPGVELPAAGQLPAVEAIAPLGLDLLLRSIWRLLSAALLLIVLIFFVALAMDLGRQEGLSALPAVLPSSITFTADYLAGLAHGNWGAADELARTLPKSLGLLATALVLAVLLGLPLGVGAALRRASRFSGSLVFASVLGISTPSFFAAMLLIWFSVWLQRATGADILPIYGFGWDTHLILPALVLAARPTASVVRLGYNALVEVIDADFVRTAHAKGLRPRAVFVRHVLRNAGVPLLTTVAVSLRFSLAVLPIVEYIFNWPGVGLALLEAIQAQDTTTVISMVLPLALLFILINLLLEILYVLVDPRLRVGEVGAV